MVNAIRSIAVIELRLQPARLGGAFRGSGQTSERLLDSVRIDGRQLDADCLRTPQEERTVHLFRQKGGTVI